MINKDETMGLICSCLIKANFKIDDAIVMKRAIENKNWKMSELVDQSLMALSVKEFIYHVETLAPDFYKVERINLYM